MSGLCVWQNSIPEHKVVTTNRLSRYDLYHAPAHRVRSPSCPLIGARGDSRERSVYSDDSEPPSLQHMAAQDHRVNDIAVRTTKGKTVKPVANKGHCNSGPTAPLVNLPLPGCPCWLLLMGLASILLATIDVKQKLGKLLGKSCQGQPHYRQPHTQQKTSYVSKYPRWKTCLLCLRLPWQLTSC
ncbi:Hypp4657 [Branchiostoma lanceolatum]|uniref:Hypp4657 protein n=1 Tax=Branchiostoma lanceolatum TaxID=7740 RepID=A0A8K0AA24_BRALA|nr:Hypp4657 [Branchiostoma lanceolatum]